MNRKVLVTGIGGVVGQGILRNINQLDMGLGIIGTNVEQISAGNYMCDRVFKVPFAYESGYIDVMASIVSREGVELIIPSTDYETYYLGAFRHRISCPVACSPPEVTQMCLDKYKTYQAFKSAGIPFADSRLPSEYKNDFIKTIVKPREGRGSRNIYEDPGRPNEFDDTYVIQEYLSGAELTTTFYSTRLNKLHGAITFVRELDSGNTTRCEVVTEYDQELNALIGKLMTAFSFAGSCNIQSRVTSRGIVPFEINCRISGTNSVRAHFGFNDVGYTIQEYLLNESPDPCHVKKGSALRVMLDIIYPEKELKDVSGRDDNFYINH